MTKYFNLGLNIFFEIDSENNTFAYTFKDGCLETRSSVSDSAFLLAEEIKEWQYRKQLNKRILFFTKKFR